MKTPSKKFGRFTLKTAKERREAREEAEYASRNGEVTISHISTRETETQNFQNDDPYAEPETDFSCEE